MTKPLWAPWRLEYITQADELEGCVFCAEAAGEIADDESLLVRREDTAIALLNKYPYSSGHLMTAPVRHVGSFAELTNDEIIALHRLAQAGMDALARVYAPDGFNLGWNLGRVAGAGITDHVHLHVVPRWSGDTNFMPVLADVKVMPEHLRETRDRLRDAWAVSD
jgi:ATP adenylyltransferase